ncbi:L,D-transpeptidase family protein [Microvirga alba]|uniref:Murein L,D-transpeptidase n=1 Tax=Microvirga alba TaxID=2791025 RepID=A0A931BNY0_9HYPH|nr:murein L,D-transpeptidase family protein [Microvirga alba]MBF9232740.1 murein L,D-transpeptidase [Microvirga alba]
MRRLLAIVVILVLAACASITILRPQLLQSASDRAIRVVALIAPELAISLRHGAAKPVSARLGERGFSLGAAAFIRIFKQESELEVWLSRNGIYELFATYPICTWSGALGPKIAEGDGQSPEGFYAVDLKQLNPNSAYYRAFNLGFPNAYDRAHGRTGSFLMVHGDCLSIGCYAMTDKGIDDIYAIVEAALREGQREVPVHAFPFRMTGDKLAATEGHRWAAYWANLKEGHDLFETTKTPPTASVCGGRYAFDASISGQCQRIASP